MYTYCIDLQKIYYIYQGCIEHIIIYKYSYIIFFYDHIIHVLYFIEIFRCLSEEWFGGLEWTLWKKIIFRSLMPYILYNNYFDFEQDILCKLCEGDGYQQWTGVFEQNTACTLLVQSWFYV